jgi:hypothetical protein
MNDALETLARELEGKARALADFPQSLMHKEALHMLAAAACAREAHTYRAKQVARRRESDDKYRENVDAHKAAMSATDAALAAFMEGR